MRPSGGFAGPGALAVTDILPAMERVVFRLTADNETLAAEALARRQGRLAPRGVPAEVGHRSRPQQLSRLRAGFG